MALPETRVENYLDAIAHDNACPHYPEVTRTRVENYLDEITHKAHDIEHKVDAMATDMKYKGSVETFEDLPTTAKKGDVYTTTSDGNEYVYDGTEWVLIGGVGGGGDPVYSTKSTSNATNGGAVYIGCKDPSQVIQLDPTVTDYHNRYVFILPFNPATVPGRDSISIMGDAQDNNCVAVGKGATAGNSGCVVLGNNAKALSSEGVAIGDGANNNAYSSISIGFNAQANGTASIALGGANTQANNSYAVALGTASRTTSKGEVSLGGTNLGSNGYNNSQYRLLTNVYDPQSAHDAATKGYVDAQVGRRQHIINVNHTTASGTWDYAFSLMTTSATPFTQLSGVADYLNTYHSGITLPISGTYTENGTVYILTKVTAESNSMVQISMRSIADGSERVISTGVVDVVDTVI